MLRPEQAKARLAEWQLPKDQLRFSEAAKKLPASLRKITKPLFGLTDDNESAADWQVRQRRKCDAAVKLDRLPAKERAKIFRLVSPQLTPAIEATWQLLKTTPYQCGYVRKAFRAPQYPDMAAETLGNWIGSIAELADRFTADMLTPAWLAAWAPYLGHSYRSYAQSIGQLLAAVLNEQTEEADEAFDILRQSLTNQHDVGATGRHVYTALLLSNRQQGWELMEKTLLAAQRQEGLRQAILESIDETHPEAFRRMLRLILDHDLIRFSSVVRAVDVWFGQLWAAASAGVIKTMLTQVVEYLENPEARDKALDGKDPQAAFLALWCVATEDAAASIPPAQKLLASKSVEMRYVAVRHLANLDMDMASAALLPALRDEDLRVGLLAIPQGHYAGEIADEKGAEDDERFESIERLLERVPDKPTKLEPLVWPWTEIVVKKSQVAACLLSTLGRRPATRLLPQLSKMDTYVRRGAISQILDARPWDAATRQAVLEFAGDASADVREVALQALHEEQLAPAEAERIERLLTRKAGDLRRSVLAILQKQDDAAALDSSRRLLAAKDAKQRAAGLELLRLMTDAKRCVADCRQLAAGFQKSRKKVTKEEQTHLDEIMKDKAAIPTLDDALGLLDAAERTPVTPPQNRKVAFVTPAAVECLKAIDDLVHEHRQTTIKFEDFSGGEHEELLGNITWGFPSPQYDRPRDKQRQDLPLADVWQQWFDRRGKKLKDKDGLELVRALAWSEFCTDWNARSWNDWAKSSPARKKIAATVSGEQAPLKLRYERLVQEIVGWLLFLSPVDARQYLLDAIETAYSLVPADEMAKLADPEARQPNRSYFGSDSPSLDWREADAFEMWKKKLTHYLLLSGHELDSEQQIRLWRLMHWRDQPIAVAGRRRVEIDLLLKAYAAGAATLADIADHLLAPRGLGEYSSENFYLLSRFTERNRRKADEAWLAKQPEVQQLVDRAVERILELELNRGDAATAATVPAHEIRSLRGVETLCRILHSLGKADFKLGHSWRSSDKDDRRQTLTQLAKVTFPADDETLDELAKTMKAAVREGLFPEERLLQLTFLAPQWTKAVEAYMGWPNMSEGVYWFLAHMRHVWGLTENAAVAAGEEDSPTDEADAEATDSKGEAGDDSDDAASGLPQQRKLSAWERVILERTPLTDAERNEGAIDVAWFRRTHQQLGEKRWQALAAAARFAANASQAKRAQFIGDVLLNKVKRQELVDGIQKKQLKEHVRLLGLLPLASGKKREADLIQRCQVLREYRRYANQLSGLTKPAALRSWEIGMKNLAQTAGYADPLRLEWAVGAEAVKDLASGPVSATVDGVTVTLTLDELSKPEVTVRKGENELKSIPPAVKKNKKIVELTSRVTDLKRQSSGIRQSLEAAMCRGEVFTGDELRAWCGHALLAPLLTRLVVVGEGIFGYPDKGGKALRDYNGQLEPVKPAETLRLAHPHDLLESDAWQNWQHECFRAERVQPFKQVFRELYVLTKQEKKDRTVSHRYDGQQVQPTQAMALFGTRGWNTRDGIFKIFHDVELTASVHVQSGVTTPAEVEGPALAGVSFTRRNEWTPVPMADVPPRLFSEVMRDLDLVVSVAHAGGVDPEASASTVEMRGSLLRETCSLLNLNNVRLKGTHAVIKGELSDYSIHLGSGVVHKMPGGSLCIVPVHAQHRGRLFLPFADDDPRTAEVVSKVMLLARDQEIQDPTILEQILRAP